MDAMAVRGKETLRLGDVESGEHLLRCLVYVDLNMVRSGVVSHTEQWTHGGYNEIQRPRRKNILPIIFPYSSAD